MLSVVRLLKVHGDMDFEEIADIIGSGMDVIDLEVKLQQLVEEKKIRVYMDEDKGVRVFSARHPEYFAEPMGDEII